MTREETVQVLSILKAAYPNAYNGMTKQEANGVIALWTIQFSKIPLQIVMIAINKLIATSKFPPAISEVKEKLSSLYFEATAELMYFRTTELSQEERKKLEYIRENCGERQEPTLMQLIENGSTDNLKLTE